MHKLVLLRHGQSTWNAENRFTGWTDVDLSPQGVAEAEASARLLIDGGYRFDVAYTSVLKRAIRTLWIVQDRMDLMWLPVHRHWRLNERHYGALQGLNKAETAAEHGADQVQIWRRSYATPPPELTRDDPRHPSHDNRYRRLDPSDLPAAESLKCTVDRFLPYWHDTIAPAIAARGESRPPGPPGRQEVVSSNLTGPTKQITDDASVCSPARFAVAENRALSEPSLRANWLRRSLATRLD